jgi:DnaJ-class molecular chaperone
MTDHYQTLGVNRNASPDEIKRAYRKLASQHHPDKGGDKTRFQEIQAAYATLSDPEQRNQYDNPRPQFHGGDPFGGFGGFPPGFEDIFSAMGGGNPFFGQGFRQQPQRNRILNIQTAISLEEAFHGKDLLANLQLPSGREQVLEIKIPAGISDGTTLRLAGMGDDSIPGAPRGDIHLTVNVHPHHKFARQGDDLLCKVDITCIDAMLGKTITVTTIDGKNLEVTINPGTQHGQILAAAGYGMPKVNDNRFKGRMLMSVDISIPKLTEEQKIILQQLTI